MERLGDLLREARLSKGLSLEQVEQETNIRLEYIQAMENEDWDFFPEFVYLKSFLRTYYRYLGLENSEYLHLLIESIKPQPIPPKIPQKIDLTVAPSRIAKIVFVFLAIIVLFSTSYIYQRFFISTPEIPEEELTPKPIVENEIVEPPEEEQEITDFSLVLSCIDDRCWVEVIDAEDNYLYRAIMTKGEEISFTNLNWVFLKLGNAGQMNVFINDKPLDKLGRIGEVITKTYGIKDNQIVEL